MNFRSRQASSSSTFTAPPVDGSLTLPEIWDYVMTYNSTHPLFVYEKEGGAIETILWSEGIRAIHTAARLVLSRCVSFNAKKGPKPLIAILAVADSITYFTLFAGVIRAGYPLFPISTRNSDAAVAHLLQKTGAKYVFVSKDKAMQTLAEGARKILAAGGGEGVEFLPMPSFDALFATSAEQFKPLPPAEHPDENSTALILHSSGSTGFPKPIAITHRIVLQKIRSVYFGETDLCGHVVAIHALPMFHAMGVVMLLWSTSTGFILSAFPPMDPPIVPTPDRLIAGAVATKSTMLVAVPAFVEQWACESDHVATLAKFDAVLYGGAPLHEEAGNHLSEHGVKLFSLYGITECGVLGTVIDKNPPKEGWQYFTFSGHVDPVFLENEAGKDVVELALQECETHTPALFNTVINGRRAYVTSDLLIRHPGNPNLFKMYGRADDQIMHSTGEKTNPLPLEAILNRDPKIESALMFGRGRFQAGVLIQPVAAHVFDPRDLGKLAQFRNGIWESIEEANRYAPAHSRIFKEMIIVTDPAKPFTYTAKGTPRRSSVLATYEHEIELAYEAFEESSQPSFPIPDVWDSDECHGFASSVVGAVVPHHLGDDDDFFQNGCDSLQATWIRNTILHALRQSSKIDVRNVPQNIVYANPTIRRLGLYIAQIAMQVAVPINGTTDEVAEMEKMVAKYTQSFPKHLPSAAAATATAEVPKGGEVVLLTGSTGGLGSYILDRLIHDSSVSRIYALNRSDSKGGMPSRRRQELSFESRGLDARQLGSEKLTLLEGDTALDNLGLDESVFNGIRREITSIIHNAWRVHFNVALSSMEPLVRGTRNLIDLALGSPHPTPSKFVFTSSIGVLNNWTEMWAPESRLLNASAAVGSGYSESKWIAESILAEAAARTPLKPVVVRVGQMSGGVNGCWNTNEWVPSIVKSGTVLGCLPRNRGRLSWVPLSTAASAIVEMQRSEHMFLNLVHPDPVGWDDIFRHFSAALNVPMVEYGEWLAKLEETADDKEAFVNNPALHLLDFFRSVHKPVRSDGEEALGFPRLKTDCSVRVAPSLKCGHLGKKDVDQWLGFWRNVGFLN